MIAPQTGVVYGPMESRRFGRSLGINLLPSGRKLCNFKCRYCQYGGHGYPEFIEFPSLQQIEDEVGEVLSHGPRNGKPIQALTIAGNGEPTLYPQFEQAIDRIIALRDRWVPKVPIGILTNGSMAHRASIRLALEKLEGCFVKLDAGNESIFRDTNSPRPAVTWEKWLEGLRQMRHMTIQSCFFDGPHSNAYDQAIQDWLEVLRSLRPDALQIYTIDRMPFDSTVWPSDRDTLLYIARLAREATGTPVSVCLPEEEENVFPAPLHRLG